MFTLYDLLGADPADDKESLKEAFRKAAKATHPDVHPDDADAPWRFRQIVRAHEILSDDELRAAYDHLLAFERRIGETRKRATLDNILTKIVSDAVAMVVLAIALFGGYVLSVYLARTPVAAATAVEVAASELPVAAVAPAQQPQTTGRGQRDDAPQRAGTGRIEADRGEVNRAVGPVLAALGEVTAVTDAAGREPAEVLEPVPDHARRDAKFFRARGVLAYHFGDFDRAIANFDAAIRLDPAFERVYLDRAVVFSLMSRFDRAGADIAQANRIKSSHRVSERRASTAGVAAHSALRRQVQRAHAVNSAALVRQSLKVPWPTGG